MRVSQPCSSRKNEGAETSSILGDKGILGYELIYGSILKLTVVWFPFTIIMNDTKLKINSERQWFKKALLIQYFHLSQIATHGRKRPTKWTLAKTANELGMSIGYVSESLKLADDFKELDLANNITREEALKRIKKC